jgi:ribonuclease HI
MTYLKVSSLNTRKSRAVMYDIASRNDWDVLCIQEPYVDASGKVPLSDVVYGSANGRIRSCIVGGRRKLKLLSHLSNEDVCVAALEGYKQMWIASVYCDIQDEPLPEMMLKALCEAKREGVKLMIQADTNSHSILWGSTETNRRGEAWEELLMTENVQVENSCDSLPTFENERGHKSHIDVTLTYGDVEVRDWHVAEETISDHREIRHETLITDDEAMVAHERKYDYRKGNWEKYGQKVEKLIRNMPRWMEKAGIDARARFLQEVLTEALNNTCPLKKKSRKRKVPWWNAELSQKRRSCNTNYRKWRAGARRGNEEGKDRYLSSLHDYKKAIVDAKEMSWKDFCSGANRGDEVSALAKAVKRKKSTVEAYVGGATTEDEHLRRLLKYHFPGIEEATEPESQGSGIETNCGPLTTYISEDSLEGIFRSFGPYKAAGLDEIKPIMLQSLTAVAREFIAKLYVDSLRKGFIPANWRKMRVTFIPKPGKDLQKENGYRPITLSSFLLKGMEKTLLNYLQEKKLIVHNDAQHAYVKGRGCDTALIAATTEMESGLKKGRQTLAVALDASGAFDRLSFSAAEQGMRTAGWPWCIRRWCSRLLRGRLVGSQQCWGKPAKGTPQGGIMSPTLWNLAMDTLLAEETPPNTKITAYADDILITSRGKDSGTIRRDTEEVVDMVERWGERSGVTFNASKTVAMVVTRKRKDTIESIRVGDTDVEVSGEIKYLGVRIDQRLTFMNHLNEKKKTLTKMMYHCKQMVGKGWGLTPERVWWVYDSIVRATLAHGAVVLVGGPLRKKRARKALSTIQRKALIGISGAMRGCPSAGLEVALGIPPLHLWLEERGAIARARVSNVLQPVNREENRRLLESWTAGKIPADLPLDAQAEVLGEGSNTTNPDGRVFHIYTDGSKIRGRAGYGWAVTRGVQVMGEGEGPLGNEATVFQGEVMAIRMALEWVRDRVEKFRRGDAFVIHSDSQSALAALGNRVIKSATVLECKRLILSLRRQYEIRLEWVRGHDDNTGNELADTLAKKGALSYQGPGPWNPMSLAWVKGICRQTTSERWTQEWQERRDCRQTKIFFMEPDGRRWKSLRTKNRDRLRAWVTFTTGHIQLRRHLAIIKEDNEADIRCRLCEMEEETPDHLMRCPCTELRRLQHDLREDASSTEAQLELAEDIIRMVKKRRLTVPERIN